jgi:hypothetical protein
MPPRIPFLAAAAVLAAVGVAGAAAGPKPAPGSVVLRITPPRTTELWDAAFDGPRVAFTLMRGTHIDGAVVQRIDGGPVSRVRYEPRGLCASGPSVCDGPYGLVLAGTQIAFAYGSAGNTSESTELFGAPAPGRTHVLTTWSETGRNPESVRRWLSYAGQGSVLAYCGPGGQMSLFHRTSSHAVAAHIAAVWAVNDRRIVAERSDDGSLEIFDAETKHADELGNVPLVDEDSGDPVSAVALQGNDLVTVAGDRIRFYDARTGDATGDYQAPGNVAAVSLYGGYLALWAEKGVPTVRVVRLSDARTATFPLPPKRWFVHAFHLSARGLDYLDGDGAGVAVREIGWPALRARLA